MKIRKGDRVVVLSGKDRGKEGEVTAVLKDSDRVIVTSPQLVNVVKKHQRQTKATMQAGIIDKEMPIHVSNVAIVGPSGPTRVGYRTEPDGTKVRICRKTGKDL
jgi:large subunit ribosomal protein L24